MKTIKYTKMDRTKIINTLMTGGILAFPTDTVFGLGCTINEDAIRKIYEAKGRSFDKPLPMMCNGINMIKNVAYVSRNAEKIVNELTPGALTLIFKRREEVNDFITNGKDTIGIRIPDDEFILSIINELDMPLLVTSANISDTGSLLKWEDVFNQLDGRIDGIVCEDARGESSSTIVDVTSDDIKVLRQGPITLDKVLEVIK